MPNVERARLQSAYASSIAEERRLAELVKSEPGLVARWLEALASTDDASRRLREHIRRHGATPRQDDRKRAERFLGLFTPVARLLVRS